MIDFSLTAEQKTLQKVAREFSKDILKPVVRAADAEPDPHQGLPDDQAGLREGL